MAIALDSKGRNQSKWTSIRRRATHGNSSRGLTGRDLEAAVMAIAAADPSLVKIESA